jgi:TolB-like protein/DNA-binding winged helix-turn-helix (wHTH) protein
MSAERYLIGKSTLDVSLGCLRRNGADVSLRPKSFALLHYLVTHAGRLVTKDELLSKIWPDVIVTEDSLTRCISEVRAALEDTGQTVIKTVSKRGYVFAGPVTLLDERAVPLPPADEVPEHKSEARRTGWMLPLLGLSAVLAMAGAVWSTAFWRPAGLPPRLSLIVLPFSNLSADPAQDYLGDIITEELTTALSRLRGSTVISSSSAFTLKGKPVDIKQLGSDLGVSYALEGSVLRSDGSMRINARLVDTQSAKTLWSDKFDVRRTELLQAQDDIVTRLASALHVELVQAETRHATGSAVANLGAEDLAMRCEAASYRRGGDPAREILQLACLAGSEPKPRSRLAAGRRARKPCARDRCRILRGALREGRRAGRNAPRARRRRCRRTLPGAESKLRGRVQNFGVAVLLSRRARQDA